MPFQPLVYRQLGGNELVVASSGLITVQAGGQLTMNSSNLNVNSGGNLIVGSSGVLTVASSGVMSIATGGQVALPVTTQATTSGTITNFGLTLIGTTIADGYTLADPDRAGLLKAIFCTIHGATTVVSTVTTASTNVTIGATSDGTATIRRVLNFTNAGQAIVLISSSTTAWVVVANVNTVGFAT